MVSHLTTTLGGSDHEPIQVPSDIESDGENSSSIDDEHMSDSSLPSVNIIATSIRKSQGSHSIASSRNPDQTDGHEGDATARRPSSAVETAEIVCSAELADLQASQQQGPQSSESPMPDSVG